MFIRLGQRPTVDIGGGDEKVSFELLTADGKFNLVPICEAMFALLRELLLAEHPGANAHIGFRPV